MITLEIKKKIYSAIADKKKLSIPESGIKEWLPEEGGKAMYELIDALSQTQRTLLEINSPFAYEDMNRSLRDPKNALKVMELLGKILK